MIKSKYSMEGVKEEDNEKEKKTTMNREKSDDR